MDEIWETEVCWEPVAGVPPLPCGDFALESQPMGNFILRLTYRNADLVLNFTGVRAFRAYWDGDAVSHQRNRPREQVVCYALIIRSGCATVAFSETTARWDGVLFTTTTAF